MQTDIERQPLHHFTEKAYLDYSMYVILDRAIPFIGDGLKPVQRRILYAMNELGIKPGTRFKKSARTIGDVLGKFHPHGDSAAYEAMVLMAQPFSYRYPLIDGQGNWGSQEDPKSFAAMRYTESRLHRYSDLLLADLDVVNYSDNFDGTLQEPDYLAAALPNILLNGSEGIAVGMATTIPSHNLGEVADACIALLKDSSSDPLNYISGPDLPSSSTVVFTGDLKRRLYENGHGGSFKIRANWYEEEGEIVITSLPPTNGAKLLASLAEPIAKNPKQSIITDVRDESDHENPIRYVLTPKAGFTCQQVMDQLYITSNLQVSQTFNLTYIGLDGKPKNTGVKEILTEWLEFRKEQVNRRILAKIEKAENRLEVLEGLLTVLANKVRVIEIITNVDEPLEVLRVEFDFTERQLNAINDLKLMRLSKMDSGKYKTEKQSLEDLLKGFYRLRDNQTAFVEYLISEMETLKKEFGDERKSLVLEIEEVSIKTVKTATIVPHNPVTVVATENYQLKQLAGHKNSTNMMYTFHTYSDEHIILIDDIGYAYTIAVCDIPEVRGKGADIKSFVPGLKGSEFKLIDSCKDTDVFLLSDSKGLGYYGLGAELKSKTKNGKRIFKPTGAMLKPFKLDVRKAGFLFFAGSSQNYMIKPVESIDFGIGSKGERLLSVLELHSVFYFEFGKPLVAYDSVGRNYIFSLEEQIELITEGIEPKRIRTKLRDVTSLVAH